MYRGIVNGVVTEEFKDGVDSFIQFALSNSSVAVDPMGNIRCPCSACKNRKWISTWDVQHHLYTRGFVAHYELWSSHGELNIQSSAPANYFASTSTGKIDPGSASRYITTLVHAHIPGPVDAWREILVPVRDLLFDMFTRRYAFTRPEDLPRARAVWESTAQTNLRKSMWEARDKIMKTTGNRDPMTWLDYGPRWATGPWQERSQAAKRNRSTHPEKNVHNSGSISYATHNQKLHHELKCAPTFRELFDRTHKRKGTDDYVSESAHTIAETYDRTMADHYVEGTPQPDLDPEAWVDAVGGSRKGRVYSFGDSLDTTPVLSSFASSVAPPAYTSSSAAPPVSGVEEMRTLIREELREELRTHFGDIVQQLISAMQGVRPSQPAPQVSITINFIYFE
ncbi:hypothetical protein Taro_047143 [Colocasia esculenta]|uniref:Transposase-associated domain-containing protein n=1 Tax=Colocasia esculenta TaxID=4460 RepID=A0A843X0F5_COLES|nr:hypothetical protein [Colocasia esculenta]